VIAADDERLVRVLLNRRAILPAEPVLPRRWIQSGLSIEFLDDGAGVVVDRPAIVRQRVDARPVHVDGGFEGLSHRAAIPGSREGDAPEIGLADLLGRGRQNRGGIDESRREGGCAGLLRRDVWLGGRRDSQKHGCADKP